MGSMSPSFCISLLLPNPVMVSGLLITKLVYKDV